ncbi:MAG: S8 family serine peptidase, partial [Nitrospirota bacterium]
MLKINRLLAILLFLFVVIMGSCGGGGGGSGNGNGSGGTTDLMEGAVPPPDTVPETTTIQYITEDGVSVDMEAVKGQVIVLFDSTTVSESAAESLIITNGGSIIAKIPSIRYYLVSVTPGNEMNFINKMRQEPTVIFVMPDIPLKAQQVIPIQPNEWEDYLPISRDFLSWYFIEINAPLAWRIASESTLQEIEIGIIECSYDGLVEGFEDFSGRVQDIPTFPIFDDHDDAVHGTAVTVFAAARGNNNSGNVGINWWSKVKLFAPPCKSDGRITNGILFYYLGDAINKGLRVINISFGYGNSDEICQPVENTIKRVLDQALFGVVRVLNMVFPSSKFIIVNSAGNDNCEHTTGRLKPNNLVIAGASNRNYGKSSLSDYGEYYIDIAAPGESLGWIDYISNISSTIPSLISGTSFSAPLVVGAAALVWAKEPNLTPPQVIQRLKDTAQPFTNLADEYKGKFGAGILDVYKALGGTEQPTDTIPPSVPTGLTATAVSSTQIDLSWTASTDNVGVLGYNIYRNGEFLKSVTSTSASDKDLSPSTTYCYTVSAYDAAGNESGQSSQKCATTHSTTTTTWVTSTIDNTGLAYTSIAVDSNNKVHISYNNWGEFKYATNASGTWRTFTIDDEDRKGVVEAYSSIAVDSNNKVRVSYYDWGAKKDLKYATNVSGTWVTSTIDSTGDVGAYTSIAVDSNNKVHISYSNWSNLKYATNTSGEWIISTIESIGITAAYTSIAVDSNNKVHISYSGWSNLKYATNTSDEWIISTIDSTISVKTYTSIAIDSNNKVHISYFDDAWNFDLKYATNASGTWVILTIDSEGYTGYHNSIA